MKFLRNDIHRFVNYIFISNIYLSYACNHFLLFLKSVLHNCKSQYQMNLQISILSHAGHTED